MSQCGSQDQSGPQPGDLMTLHPDYSGTDEYLPAATNSGQSHTNLFWDLQFSKKQHSMTA